MKAKEIAKKNLEAYDFKGLAKEILKYKIFYHFVVIDDDGEIWTYYDTSPETEKVRGNKILKQYQCPYYGFEPVEQWDIDEVYFDIAEAMEREVSDLFESIDDDYWEF